MNEQRFWRWVGLLCLAVAIGYLGWTVWTASAEATGMEDVLSAMFSAVPRLVMALLILLAGAWGVWSLRRRTQ